MLRCLTFGHVRSDDYKIWLSGKDTFDIPKKVYQEITVPGRSGVLMIDEKRLENVFVRYQAVIAWRFFEDYSRFANSMLSTAGYQRLEDTFHPDEYRMAVFQGGIHPEVYGVRNQSGKFTIEFNCKPQRYLKKGENPVEFTSNGIIYNPTFFEAKPLIRVYGNGVLGIGEETVTISGVSNYADIDCEIEDAYQGAVNLNGNIVLSSGEFPILKPGNNGISVDTGISKVVIIPRWWII